jgi:hypothetical protein
MARIVLRVRLVGGGQMDVSCEDADTESESDLLDQVTETLAEDSGTVRCRHGERLVVLFGRGVAGFEVSPRGAIL